MDFSKLTDEELQLAENLAKWTKGKFSEEQFKNAKKVQEKTIAKGLNPDFILPMVMAESGFNQNAKSPKGADGVMQITPDTADFYKCKNVKDLDQNIDCGLNMISDLVSKKTIGNDPYKVLSGYNAGPNTKYFTSGNIEDLPDETISHMDKVSDFYGGSLPYVSGEKPKESEASETSDQKDSGGNAEIKDPNNIIKPPPKGLPGESDPYAFIGGVTGATIAGHVETGKKLLPLIPNLINKVTGQAVDVNKPVSKQALQGWLNSMLQSNGQNVKLPVSELEKLTGKKIRTMGELGEAYKDIQEVKEQKVTKPMVKMVEGRPGVFEQTGRMTTSTVPGRPAIDLTPYEIKQTGPIRQAIGNQMETAGSVVKGALPSVGRIGVGALGGAVAGSQLYDAFEEYKKAGPGLHMPTARNAAQFASGLGGALSMLPFGVTQGAGLVLQAPELAYQGYDALKALQERSKNAPQEDTDRIYLNNPMP
jgi:hypothetical protein